MSRVKIELRNDRTEEDHTYLDLNGLCSQAGLRHFQFEDEDGKKFFALHEPGEETFARFMKRSDMTQHVLAYNVAQMANGQLDFISFSGLRGLKIMRTLTADEMKRKAEKKAMEYKGKSKKKASAPAEEEAAA